MGNMKHGGEWLNAIDIQEISPRMIDVSPRLQDFLIEDVTQKMYSQGNESVTEELLITLYKKAPKFVHFFAEDIVDVLIENIEKRDHEKMICVLGSFLLRYMPYVIVMILLICVIYCDYL